MTADAQRAKALSSAAAVLSAFLVFVLGGGVLLGVWAQQRGLAESAAEQARITAAQERTAEQDRKAKAAAEAEKVQRKTPKRPTRTRTKAVKSKADSSGPTTIEAAKVAKAAPAAKALTGRGSVLVYGDATRVRLMGSTGTFGAGKVPAGRYTVQATFLGFEPRLAGTVEVSNGARLSLVCASSTKTCEVR